MRAVARVFAFGIGLAAGLALLGGLTWLHRGLWLPVGLGIVLSALLYTSSWVRARGLAGVVSLALGTGVSWGWLVTSGSSSRRFDVTYLPTALMGVVAVLTSAAALAVVLYLPAKQRPPGWRLAVPVVMAWIVGMASSSAGGASPMHHWFVEHFGLTLSQAETAVFWLRKTIHFIYYGSMGLAAWSAANSAKEAPSRSFRFGVLFALAVASFDELRQMTSAGRSASAYDVLLDLAGALAFVGLATYRAGLRGKRSRGGTGSRSGKGGGRKDEG